MKATTIKKDARTGRVQRKTRKNNADRPKPTLEEISESPLLFDARRYWPWACKRYGRPFMTWVKTNWRTASEREIQVMHRAWIAAGGAAS